MASAVTIAILLCLAFAAVAAYRFSKAGSGTRRVGAYDPKTGIGRGAPGFQTNVTRIAVPAHIVARIRAGEDVSAEEITAAQEAEAKRLAKEERAKAQGRSPRTVKSNSTATPDRDLNEWIPSGQGHGASPAGRAKSRSKRG